MLKLCGFTASNYHNKVKLHATIRTAPASCRDRPGRHWPEATRIHAVHRPIVIARRGLPSNDRSRMPVIRSLICAPIHRQGVRVQPSAR